MTYSTMRLFLLLLSLTALAVSAQANLITTLAFDSLPSAQGWTLSKSGPHANDSEASLFTATGSSLLQSSVGKGMGFASPGHASYIYEFAPEVAASEDVITLLFRTAVTAHEQTRQDFSYAAHRFTIVFKGWTTYVGIKPGQLYANGTYFTPAGFDGSQANNYRLVLDADAGTFEFFLNGDSVRTAAAAGSGSADGLYIADGTGTANADATISRLSAYSGNVIPEPSALALLSVAVALALPLLRRRRC